MKAQLLLSALLAIGLIWPSDCAASVEKGPAVPLPIFAPFGRDGPPAVVTISPDGSTIYVVGRITEDTFELFLNASRAAPKARTVSLASGGGEIMGGYVMGNLVRLLKLNTHVDALCLSACTLVFGAGVERSLGPFARLGYHQSYRILPSGEFEAAGDYSNEANFAKLLAEERNFAFGGGSDELFVHAMRPLGVSDSFIRRVLQTPPESMWFPDRALLVQEHLITRTYTDVDPSPVAPAAGSKSRDEISQAMRQKPFWKAFAVAEPEAFSRHVINLWLQSNSALLSDEDEWYERAKADEMLVPRLATASDDLLDKFAEYLGNAARLSRGFHHLGCFSPSARDPAFDKAMRSLRDAADPTFVALLESKAITPALNQKQAEKIIEKNYWRLAELGAPTGPPPTDKIGACRTDDLVTEAIGRLPPKFRVLVTRAGLSLRKTKSPSEEEASEQ